MIFSDRVAQYAEAHRAAAATLPGERVAQALWVREQAHERGELMEEACGFMRSTFPVGR